MEVQTVKEFLNTVDNYPQLALFGRIGSFEGCYTAIEMRLPLDYFEEFLSSPCMYDVLDGIAFTLSKATEDKKCGGWLEQSAYRVEWEVVQKASLGFDMGSAYSMADKFRALVHDIKNGSFSSPDEEYGFTTRWRATGVCQTVLDIEVGSQASTAAYDEAVERFEQQFELGHGPLAARTRGVHLRCSSTHYAHMQGAVQKYLAGVSRQQWPVQLVAS